MNPLSSSSRTDFTLHSNDHRDPKEILRQRLRQRFDCAYQNFKAACRELELIHLQGTYLGSGGEVDDSRDDEIVEEKLPDEDSDLNPVANAMAEFVLQDDKPTLAANKENCLPGNTQYHGNTLYIKV